MEGEGTRVFVAGRQTGAMAWSLVPRLGAQGVVMYGMDAVSVGEAVAVARPGPIAHQMAALPVAYAAKPDAKHPDRRFATTYGPGVADVQVKLVRRRRFPLVGGGIGHLSWAQLRHPLWRQGFKEELV